MYLYMRNILDVPANSALLRELLYVRDEDFFPRACKGQWEAAQSVPLVSHVLQTFCLCGQV